MNSKFFSRQTLWSDTAILVYLALAKLLIHLLTANNYGYFGDELYWLAMAKHLDFGYVDVPPLVAYLGALWQALFGASLFSIHILPALAGAVMVFFSGLLARELGGGRFAQWSTALMVLSAPGWLMLNSWFAYDPFDQMNTVILLYLIVRLIQQETPRRWIGIGIVAGLGVMIKLSMPFMLFALIVGLIASPLRKSFRVFGRKDETPWPWLAALIAILVCVPYLIWQWVHGWPLITYWRSYAFNRPHFGPMQFLQELILLLNPFLLLFLLPGLLFLLFHQAGKKYRPLGLSFLILLVIFMGIMRLESRMLLSACFPLLAAGAVWLERISDGAVSHGKIISMLAPWFKRVYLGCIVICGLLLAPLLLPVLPVSTLEKYLTVIPKFISEDSARPGNKLPFPLACRFGWPELVKKVASIYQSLPEADRKKCVIWADIYPHAAAIDLLGKEYGLPNAISNHYSYQFWGPDPSHSGINPEVIIFLGGVIPEGIGEVSTTALVVGNPNAVTWNRYQMIYVCRKPSFSLKEIWPRLANFY